MALPPTYAGRNSAKDIQSRVASVEEQTIPAVQADLAALETEFEQAMDMPDAVLLFNAALT